MRFNELVRLLEQNGFRLIKEKDSNRYYGKPVWTGSFELIIWSKRNTHLQCHPKGCGLEGAIRRGVVIDLKYSLVIEATEDPTFFGFYSPDLEGFTGICHSIEDCLYQAKWGMEEHIELLKEQSLPIPQKNPDPKIVIQNQEALARAS